MRLPFAPLERIVARKIGREPNVYELCAWFHFPQKNYVYRYRQNGLNPYAADRLACLLGYHPMNVWGIDAWINCFSDEEMDKISSETPERHLKIVTVE